MAVADIDPQSIESIHFIGIGGVGMSAIALIARERGIAVSGSDMRESRETRACEQAGIRVFIGHDPSNICDPAPDIVVISSAIPDRNVELVSARERGIPVWRRAHMLAWLGHGRKTLAVAGTHGKTTTSSMLGTALDRLDADPTFVIGGTVGGYGANAIPGGGEYYVVEADESDGTFTYLDPFVAVVTNIEEDHLDHYHDLAEIESAFVEFASAVPAQGCIVTCAQDPHLPELMRSCGRDVLTYGFAEGCDVTCGDIVHEGLRTRFTVTQADGTREQITLAANPGTHNVLNATAVFTVLRFLGYAPHEAAEAVSAFEGVGRRFDFVGRACGVDIVDDYGHHPTEVAATVKAAGELGYRRVHVLFQPHRYSRTQALAERWADAFDGADALCLMDVYSAGETPIPGVTGKLLVNSVLDHNPRAQVAWLPHRSDVPAFLAGRLHEGDLLITMGAGDVTTMGPLVLQALERGDAR